MTKRFEEASKLIDKKKAYGVKEAIELSKKASNVKFDETVEVSIRLSLDKEPIRSAVVLPNGNGKQSVVLVIAKGDAAKAAKEAGADFVGDNDMIDKIAKENWFDYDTIIATPDMMGELGKIGKVLGPKGLMPNPKTGTVTTDTRKAVEEAKKGKVAYRSDANGNVHVPFGKISFDADKLLENLNVIIESVQKMKPKDVKGDYIKNISISSTMGPGIRVSIKEFDK